MSDDDDIIRGSGNVFRDLGLPNADREQRRALLAARRIREREAAKQAKALRDGDATK